jgi:hypothetical protein
MRFISVIMLVLGCSIRLAHPQQKIDRTGTVQFAGLASSQRPSSDDIQSLRSDLQRMKVLMQQMESNLAFVDTSQSPLKRQFQLEIDMWKIAIGDMERKLNAAGAR